MARTPSDSAANQLVSGLRGPIKIIREASAMACRDALREPTRAAQAEHLGVHPATWYRVLKILDEEFPEISSTSEESTENRS